MQAVTPACVLRLAALAVALSVARPALAAGPCIQFEIEVTDENGAELAPTSQKFKRVRGTLQDQLVRLRNEAARAFGESGLAVDFVCGPEATPVIARVGGSVVTSALGERFEGSISFLGPVWHERIRNEWELAFEVGSDTCKITDQLLAISNALIDHRRSKSLPIRPQTVNALRAFREQSCGIAGSASQRQLVKRLALLGT